MRDLYHRIGLVHLLDAQNLGTNDGVSNILDLLGFHGATVIFNIGEIGETLNASNYVTVKLQESDSTADASFTDVAAEDLHGSVTVIDSSAEDQTTIVLGYRGSKRYIRGVAAQTGTGITSFPISIDAIVAFPADAPPTPPAAIAAT